VLAGSEHAWSFLRTNRASGQVDSIKLCCFPDPGASGVSRHSAMDTDLDIEQTTYWSSQAPPAGDGGGAAAAWNWKARLLAGGLCIEEFRFKVRWIFECERAGGKANLFTSPCFPEF